MNEKLYIYRIGFLKKDKYPEELRERLKYKFVICSEQIQAYQLVLEAYMDKMVIRTFALPDLKRIARAYGLRVLKWHEVGMVNEEVFAFNDEKYISTHEKNSKRLEKARNYVREVLHEDIENRNFNLIRKRIQEIEKTIGQEIEEEK